MNLFRLPVSKRERLTFTLLLSLIALNVLFIFSNSLLPQAESAEQSGRVAALIRMLLPEGNAFGDFLVYNIRKIAHFVEFGALGALSAVFSAIFGKQSAARVIAASLQIGRASCRERVSPRV